jgi:transposase
MISVGIDVHKKRCQACLKDQDGTLLEELSFQNNPEGITQLRTLLSIYPEAKVALESTGNLWTRIYQVLKKQEPYRAQRDDLLAKKLKRLEQRASSSLQAN